MRTLYLLLFVLLVGQATAQRRQNKLDFTDVNFDLKGVTVPVVSVSNPQGDNFFIVRNDARWTRESDFHLIRADADLQQSQIVPLELEAYGAPLRMEYLRYRNGGLELLASAWDQDRRIATLYRLFFDPQTLTQQGQAETILTYPSGEKTQRGSWHINSSPNRKLILAEYRTGSQDINKRSIELYVLNEQLKVELQARPDLSQSSTQRLSVAGGRVSDGGDVTFVVLEIVKRTARTKTARNRLAVYLFSPGVEQSVRHEVADDDGYALVAGPIRLTQDGRVLLCGHYHTPYRQSNVALGYYLKEYDLASFTLQQDLKIPFAKVKDKYSLEKGDKTVGKAKQLREFTNFNRLRSLLLDTAGNTYLVGYQNYIVETTSRTGFTAQERNVRNVTVAKVTPSGRVQFVRSIPMSWSFNADYPSSLVSVYPFLDGDRLCLLFNDRASNARRYTVRPRPASILTERTLRLVTLSDRGRLRDYHIIDKNALRKNWAHTGRARYNPALKSVDVIIDNLREDFRIHRVSLGELPSR